MKYKLQEIIIITLCALHCIFCSCITNPGNNGQTSLSTTGENVLMTREFYGLLSWDNKAFYNNCWGMGYLRNQDIASSVVFYDPASTTCGWRWSWPREAVDKLKGYPCLFVGDKVYAPAGLDRSTDPRFPLHLPLMKSLWTFNEIRVTGSGDFNFSYDLAFLEGPYSAPPAVRSEIMIWLTAYLECPAEKDGEYVIGDNAYDFFINTDWNPGVPYQAFVLKNDSLPQRLPLHEFIRIGIDKGYVDPDAYLAAVELGPEIWWGDGEASVSDFRISLNGD
jgi:hypothetical protein